MQFEIPIRTVSEMNQREHWKARYRRKKVQQKITQLFLPKKTPTGVHRISLTRVAPRAFDPDNLAASFKNIIDTICDWLKPGLAPGQSDRGLAVTFHQRKGKPKEYKVIVHLE